MEIIKRLTPAAITIAAVAILFFLFKVLGDYTHKGINLGNAHVHSLSLNGKYLKNDIKNHKSEQVIIGIYPINIYDINLESGTFNMTAYLWLSWKGNIDPTSTLEFTNAVGDISKTIIYETPKNMSDGSKYNTMRIDGCFAQPFDLKRFPLDGQTLNIYLEENTYPFDQITYNADTKNSGFDSNMTIPGWNITSLNSRGLIHDYITNFGDSSLKNASKYSSLNYAILIERNTNYFVWKLIFPMIIVLLTNWFSLLLKPSWVDLRTTMPATALLTAVFLQLSYSDKLPQISYLILIDKIYILFYLFIIATLLQIIWGNSQIESEEDEINTIRVIRIDRISMLIQFALFIIILLLLVLSDY